MEIVRTGSGFSFGVVENKGIMQMWRCIHKGNAADPFACSFGAPECTVVFLKLYPVKSNRKIGPISV